MTNENILQFLHLTVCCYVREHRAAEFANIYFLYYFYRWFVKMKLCVLPSRMNG